MALVRTGYANFAAFPVTGAVDIIYVDLSNGDEYTWVTSAYVAYTPTLVGVSLGDKSAAWFVANPNLLLAKGQVVFLDDQSGNFKKGDGITALSALSFLGGTQGVQSVTGTNVDNTDPLNPIVNRLGLIQIVDKDENFFTDLATASAYIRTFIDENVYPITDESFNLGVYYFTVPQGTKIELSDYFLGDASVSVDVDFIDEFGLVTEIYDKAFHRNIGKVYLGDSVLFSDNVSSITAFRYFGGEMSIGSYDISATATQFGRFSTGKFTFRGNIGADELDNFNQFFFNSTATIFANASKYTSNAGQIHGALQTATAIGVNVFFDGIDKLKKETVISSNHTALPNEDLTIVVTCTITDPTPSEGMKFKATLRNGTATIGGVAYSVVGTRIERIYHSGAWATYIYQSGKNKDTILCNFTATTFVDNTSYFCGTLIAPASSTTNTRRRFRYPFSGTITKIFFTNGVTVATSSQDCVLKINNLTQATSATVGNIRFDNVDVTADFTGLSIAGNENDNCEIEVAVPALTKNGSGCLASFQITIEKN